LAPPFNTHMGPTVSKVVAIGLTLTFVNCEFCTSVEIDVKEIKMSSVLYLCYFYY
jgi:hypothetical protein